MHRIELITTLPSRPVLRFDFRGELLGIALRGGYLLGEVVNPDSTRQPRFRAVFRQVQGHRRTVSLDFDDVGWSSGASRAPGRARLCMHAHAHAPAPATVASNSR